MNELAPTYGVCLACELLALPRSSFYYQADQPGESDCKVAIQEIAGQRPRYGYRRTLAPAAHVQVSPSSCGETSNWWSTASECGVSWPKWA